MKKLIYISTAFFQTFMLAVNGATYDTGANEKEIKIGQTMPYSGPLAVFSTMAKTQMAYFEMLNQKGGLNGRKLILLSRDDAYNPSKTVEQTRKLDCFADHNSRRSWRIKEEHLTE